MFFIVFDHAQACICWSKYTTAGWGFKFPEKHVLGLMEFKIGFDLGPLYFYKIGWHFLFPFWQHCLSLLIFLSWTTKVRDKKPFLYTAWKIDPSFGVISQETKHVVLLALAKISSPILKLSMCLWSKYFALIHTKSPEVKIKQNVKQKLLLGLITRRERLNHLKSIYKIIYT